MKNVFIITILRGVGYSQDCESDIYGEVYYQL
ncbi:uncharacterized protein METZ01_LOCUS172330 [marine metagenome]|uniref:Uncharacterized protein n=1 Tax=marine metagenome TaxID=408172 RepID=A0A382C089_9ZZZZ